MEKTKDYSKLRKEVEDLVKKYCKNNYNYDDIFENHVDSVRNYSLELAEFYDADKEVVETASLLHDFTYIRDNNHDIHEIEGARFALEYLEGKMSEEKVKLISNCILHHRGSRSDGRKSVEEKIVACADAMSHFSNFHIFFYIRGAGKKGSLEDTISWMKSKLKRSWNKIDLDRAKEIIKPKYDAAMVFLSDD